MATNKEKWVGAIKKKNPTKTYENEDELFGDAMSDYENVKGQLKKFKDDDAKAMAILSQNPDVQGFLAVVLNEGDFGKAMAQLPDFTKMSDEEKLAYDVERKRKLKMRDDAAAKEKSFMENLEKNAQQLQEWQDKNGIPMEKIVAAIDYLKTSILDKLESGNFDVDFIEQIFRLMNYDNDIKASKEAGILEGRNLAAGERAMRRKEGDGLPVLGSGGAVPEKPKDARANLVDSIARVNRRNDIFR